MPTIEKDAPRSQAVGGTATITVTNSWSPPEPPQHVGGLEAQILVVEAAGRRVLEKYPETLQRLAE